MGKMWIDRVTGQQRKIDARCELDLKLTLKGLECKYKLLQSVLIKFNQKNYIHSFCKTDIMES